MKKFYLFTLVAIVAIFTACTYEITESIPTELEIKLKSEVTPASRVADANYQSTQIVEGQQVGVTITGAKNGHINGAWTAGADGSLTNTEEAVYYGNGTATITAYHPYNSIWESTSHMFSVGTDQSTNEGYLASDLLWATATSAKTESPVVLTFAHMLAKINVTLTSTDMTDLSDATISICGTNIATNFNSETGELSTATTANVQEIKAGVTTPNALTASAIVIPQTVEAGTKFIKVSHGGKTLYYTLTADKELKSGHSYSYTLTVKEAENELKLRSENIIDWENEMNEGDLEVPDSNSLTILSYLVANNNLNSALKVNIGTMYDGLAIMKKPATLLVYWDGQTSIGPNSATHLILKYRTDGKGNINGMKALDYDVPLDDVLEAGEIVKEYPNQVSTDKDVMKQVLKDMANLANSNKLGVIVGSHGSSWLNTIAVNGRAIGYDGSTSNSISLPDMVEAFQGVGKKFEFVLFDACFMGTAEVAYAFRNVADYQISSAMEVPAYGFPYDVFMGDLYEGTVNSYKEVCQTFIDYYELLYENGNSAWGCVSLIDSKEVGNLTEQLKVEITEHKDLLANYNTSKLEEYGKSSGPYLAYDLGDWMKDLNGGSLPAGFSSQLNKTVIYKDCLDKAYPSNYAVNSTRYSGLGIYIPVKQRSNWNNYFKTLDWYTAAGWNEVTFSWEF